MIKELKYFFGEIPDYNTFYVIYSSSTSQETDK